MRAIFRSVVVSVLLFTMMKTALPASCVCVRGGLKAAGVRGRVVATYKQRPEEPISNATVKLLKCFEGDCQTVAEVTADESGGFSIDGIKSGKYEIVASAAHFASVWVQLEVRGKATSNKKEIVFGLEPDFDCCAGWAMVRKTNAK